jgi:hypothetical protein
MKFCARCDTAGGFARTPARLARPAIGLIRPIRMAKTGRLPKGTYISPNRRVWFEDEIIAWQNAVDEFDPNRGRQRASPPCRLVRHKNERFLLLSADTR